MGLRYAEGHKKSSDENQNSSLLLHVSWEFF